MKASRFLGLIIVLTLLITLSQTMVRDSDPGLAAGTAFTVNAYDVVGNESGQGQGVLGFGKEAKAQTGLVYYVDYESGNDSNNGLSTSTPWKHCPGDSAATGNADITLQPGDTVIFKGGVVYTGTGSGTLITIENSGNSANYITYRGNTEAGDWGSGKAEIDLDAMYYHALQSSYKNYIKVINFYFKEARERDGITANEGCVNNRYGNNWLIKDCVFGEFEDWDVMCPEGENGNPPIQRGIMLYGDGTDNIEIDNCEFYALPYPIRMRGAEYVDIHDCNFTGAATYQGTGPDGGYMSLPLLMTNDTSNINISDNIFRDGWRYEGDDILRRCHSGDWIHMYGGPAGQPHDIIIERNLFYNDKEFAYTHGTAISLMDKATGPGDGPYEITWRNNIFLNPHAGNGVLYLKNTGAVYIHNNLFVIYNHGDGASRGISIGSGARDDLMEIKNNIFISYVTNSATTPIYTGTEFDGECDYNIYYKTNYTNRIIRQGSSTYYSLEEWQALGNDEHGYFGDPNLVNLPGEGEEDSCGSGDYHLTALSTLAINNGIDLSAYGFNDDFDGVIRPQGIAWDIGAYEYIDSGPDTTPPTRSDGAPTGELAAGTTSTNISLTTNESATCRYSTTPNIAYESMTNTFSTTGTTSHSTTVSGLENGGSYTYYVRCEDAASNANPDDYPIIFSVAGPLALHGTPANQTIHLSWTVNTTLPVTSTWQIAYDGPAGDQPSPISGIISPTRAYTLTGLTNYTWYTVTLNAMSDSTPFLTDTVRVMPSDIFVYLPLVLKGP